MVLNWVNSFGTDPSMSRDTKRSEPRTPPKTYIFPGFRQGPSAWFKQRLSRVHGMRGVWVSVISKQETVLSVHHMASLNVLHFLSKPMSTKGTKKEDKMSLEKEEVSFKRTLKWALGTSKDKTLHQESRELLTTTL